MAEPRGSVGLKPLPLPRRPWPAPLLLSFALGLYLLAFFLAPAATVLLRALIGQHGIDLEFLVQLLSPVYLRAFANTLWVSALSGILAVLLGFLIAYAALRSGPWRTVILSFSGVAANFAGVPLAFAFIATLGTRGILTELLNGVGIHLYEMGFSLFSLAGLVLVYLYFQTPLMVLLITPALEGLRQEWFEAAASLGASPWRFWWRIGLPILAPSLLSTFVLLFGNAFAAYATPYALTGGQINLVPILLGAFLTGNVMADPQLGYALSLGMVLLLAISMVLYTLLQRWAKRRLA
jgi:putative spermidine/putrescine transport system permease protein